jgi:8-oxo-dGTP pyrophosphatase MutT (NUDIX family)
MPAVTSGAQLIRRVLQTHPPERVQIADAREAAVLIPIVAGSQPSLIFTVRTDTLPSHKGQISFPGGSVDEGETPRTAAVREAHEELGLEPATVDVLGELDAVPTFVSGYVIHPFVGWVAQLPELVPNPAEVADVLVVPIDDLSEEIRALPGFSHGGRTYPTEAWIWKENVIWGATARVLRVLLERLAQAGLANRPGESPGWPSWPSIRGA